MLTVGTVTIIAYLVIHLFGASSIALVGSGLTKCEGEKCLYRYFCRDSHVKGNRHRDPNWPTKAVLWPFFLIVGAFRKEFE